MNRTKERVATVYLIGWVVLSAVMLHVVAGLAVVRAYFEWQELKTLPRAAASEFTRTRPESLSEYMDELALPLSRVAFDVVYIWVFVIGGLLITVLLIGRLKTDDSASHGESSVRPMRGTEP